jgi:hypothetical protein
MVNTNLVSVGQRIFSFRHYARFDTRAPFLPIGRLPREVLLNLWYAYPWGYVPDQLGVR